MALKEESAAPDTSVEGVAPEGTVEDPILGEPPVQDSTVGQTVADTGVQADESEMVKDEPDPDSFDWDTWQLSDLDALPEQVRPWAGKIVGRQTTFLDEKAREAEKYKNLYEALNFGDEDPRIAEMTAERDRYQNEYQTLQQQVTDYQQDLARFQEERAEEEYRWFSARYGDELAGNPGLEDAIADVYSFGEEQGGKVLFSLEESYKIATRGEEAITLAKELSSEGVPVNRIFQLLDLQRQVNVEPTVKEPKPNPAVDLVAGSTPIRAPKQPPVDKSNMTEQEIRQLAARKAIARHKRR